MSEIDFSKISPPDVIEQIDYEVILQEMKDDLLAREPGLTAVTLESEPITKTLEQAAYREVLIRKRVNEGAHAVMLPYATGTDLDNLAAFYPAVRLQISPPDDTTIPPTPAVFESDEEFRERIRLALDSRTTAGAANTYKFYALSADSDAGDVSITSPTPGLVVVTVLSRGASGIPDQSVLDNIFAAVNADDVRPMTDTVHVNAATIVNYDVTASLTIYPGPDPVTVLSESIQSINDYAAARRKLGNDITVAGVIAALAVDGVQNVALTEPAADIVIDDTQAPIVGNINVSIGGIDV